jgi:hypothetical protein
VKEVLRYVRPAPRFREFSQRAICVGFALGVLVSSLDHRLVANFYVPTDAQVLNPTSAPTVPTVRLPVPHTTVYQTLPEIPEEGENLKKSHPATQRTDPAPLPVPTPYGAAAAPAADAASAGGKPDAMFF